VHCARYLLSSLDRGFSCRETILKFVVHLGFKIGKKTGVTWWKSNLSFMFPINGISRFCITQFNNKYICDASTVRNILSSGLLLQAVQPIQSEVSSCPALNCEMIVLHLDDMESN
jgi:hypothetical protein